MGVSTGQRTEVGSQLQPPTPSHRKLLREEELQATSLPSIPNPFPELCSPPSQTPILGGPSSTRGLLPRDATCLHVSHPGEEKAGIWGDLGLGGYNATSVEVGGFAQGSLRV